MNENIVFLVTALGMGLGVSFIKIIRSQITNFAAEYFLASVEMIYCGSYILSVSNIVNIDVEKINFYFTFIGVIVFTLIIIYLGTILVFRPNKE